MSEDKYYITCAIDYPNGVPHMGHAYEKIIADVFARWKKQQGRKVFFSIGTDEHGQKIEKTAEMAGVDTKSFVDDKVEIFKDMCASLNLSFDNFIRTTDSKHEAYAAELFDRVLKKGEIYLGKYSGHYCIFDERFFTEKELLEGELCPECNRKTQVVEEESYFFKMGLYQDRIIKYIEENNFITPATRQNEILYRLKNTELKDLCVSRTSFKWGVPLKNDPKHVIYVWFDALINYLSSIGYPEGENASMWPCDAHVIGKDILWFHAVIWPAMLMALDIPLPKKIYAHGFIMSKDGTKMSKSKGNAVDPIDMMDKYGAEALRYYMLKVVPSTDDGNFSEEELVERYNNELGNDLGNLVMRCVKLSLKKIGAEVSAPEGYTNSLKEFCDKVFADASSHIEKYEYDRALESVWSYVKRINAYLTENEPWKVDDSLKFHEIMFTALDNLLNAITMLKPFIPGSVEKIEKQLGLVLDFSGFDGDKVFKLTDDVALYPKIEWKAKELFIPFLKVAKIVSVAPHPDAEKLFVIQVDLGDEKRQVVAGLRANYSADELVDKQVVLVTNLKPAKLRGQESNGMILAGVEEETVKVLDASDLSVGDIVMPAGEYEVNVARIKIDDFVKVKLEISNGKILFDGNSLQSNSGKEVKTELKSGKVY